MIKTTAEELGQAYKNASRWIMQMDPITPRIMGALWREHLGLHHRYKKNPFGKDQFWIEFPNDKDYTVFMLRWS